MHTYGPKIPYKKLIFNSTLSWQSPNDQGLKVDAILSFSEPVFIIKPETHMPSPERAHLYYQKGCTLFPRIVLECDRWINISDLHHSIFTSLPHQRAVLKVDSPWRRYKPMIPPSAELPPGPNVLGRLQLDVSSCLKLFTPWSG